jgi:succinylglutamate desuccinylase
MLTIYEDIPSGLLQCEATELHRILPGPSLIHLPGDRPEPLFISVLLHGNETTGWDAIRAVLEQYREKKLPRALSLFIGNVRAARHSLRHLDDQPDFNRIWKAEGHGKEETMVRQVLEEMRERDVFACIDIHNNTGHNPHYACVNRLATPFFQLARLFSRTVVYFIKPDSVLSMAFANICPSVTVECGRPVEQSGVLHAQEFILSALQLDHLDEQSMSVRDIDLFHTVAVVKLRHDVTASIDDESAHVQFLPDIDLMNFCEIISSTQLARVRHGVGMPLVAENEFGKDVADRYFEVSNGWLCNTTPVMPSMLTLDMDIVRQDCLCYLMERLDLDKTLSA